MVVVAAVALSSATYAWFVNNAQVTATNVNVQAATAYSLLIANDHATWGTTTELENTVAKLTPVSTVGEIASAAKILTSSPKVGYGDDTTVAQYDVEFVRMSSGAMTAKTIENYCADGKATDMAVTTGADKLADAPVTEFDEQLWISMVDHMVVHNKEDIRVVYRDGNEK